jgi:hypothetical protein
MADEARKVAQPPPDVSHARRLADAEVVGDGVHVQEPRDGHSMATVPMSARAIRIRRAIRWGREVSRATWLPLGRCVRRERFVAILVDTTRVQ